MRLWDHRGVVLARGTEVLLYKARGEVTLFTSIESEHEQHTDRGIVEAGVAKRIARAHNGASARCAHGRLTVHPEVTDVWEATQHGNQILHRLWRHSQA